MLTTLLRVMTLGLSLVALAACDPTRDLDEPPVSLGDFKLGHNIVVAPEPQTLPGSRQATQEEWQAALTKAIDARFGRYDGAKLYHFGVNVGVYSLAFVDIPVPGIPSQKSALAVNVSIWDDAKGAKLNEEPKQIFVVAGPKAAGVNPDKQVQMDHLAALVAKSMETWLLENPEWLGLAPSE